ncbi:hypothetical protein C8Q80DRAFT_1134694 [Daedaleopsis nitida]|nr:hypothetical protein C8Q80DRAFT_1134694 [Daedaleopsis nitida]
MAVSPKLSSCSSASEYEDEAAALIRSLDSTLVASLALEKRRSSTTSSVALTCAINEPPKHGAFNVIYRADFSDGVSWIVRVPFTPWDATHAHDMRLDMVGLHYIVEHTSIPIPHIHAHDCTVDNVLQHPYIIMDYVHGTPLIDVWNDPSWWTGERSKERTLTSIAHHMVELSKLEFDKIGRLDRTDPAGPYHIVPFTSAFSYDPDYSSPSTSFGPFTTIHAYLHALLDARQEAREQPSDGYAMLGLFIGGLPDMRYDGAPFTLNILVDASGDVAAFIDWDGLATQPRQLGALAYPAWITVDWDPLVYHSYQDRPGHDTEADLHAYREMYTRAVDRLSEGKLGDVVRNSHIVCTLATALFSPPTLYEILGHVGKYVFGSIRLTFEALDGVEHSAWFTQDHREVAEVKGASVPR